MVGLVPLRDFALLLGECGVSDDFCRVFSLFEPFSILGTSLLLRSIQTVS